MNPFEEIPNPFEEVPYKPPKRKTPLRKRTVKLIWFRMGLDRDYPLYIRKAYKKARHKRKSERLTKHLKLERMTGVIRRAIMLILLFCMLMDASM